MIRDVSCFSLRQGNKPVSIPFNKMLSFNCYNNRIDVYKDGREKGYSFRSRIAGRSNCLASVWGSCSAAGRTKASGTGCQNPSQSACDCLKLW